MNWVNMWINCEEEGESGWLATEVSRMSKNEGPELGGISHCVETNPDGIFEE